MKKKLEIKTYLGTVLFTHECEDNTVEKTLEEAVRCDANLRYVNLSGANLSDANLSGANLSDANLGYANLSGANLRGANLRYVNLSGANLSGANLRGANLSDANLGYANLSGANLSGANLSGANLSGANLSGANLSDANLSGVKNAEYAMAQTIIVSEGNIFGWKLCKDNILVKLLIPKESKRSNASGRKCRAEYAQVLELTNLNDKRKKVTEAVSEHDGKTTYKVGETVTCHEWNEDRWEECAGGIHFFITELEAINYK